MINEQFIDRVINALIEQKLDEKIRDRNKGSMFAHHTGGYYSPAQKAEKSPSGSEMSSFNTREARLKRRAKLGGDPHGGKGGGIGRSLRKFATKVVSKVTGKKKPEGLKVTESNIIDEQFIDKVISILLEMRLDENDPNRDKPGRARRLGSGARRQARKRVTVKQRNKLARHQHDEDTGREENREQGNPSSHIDTNIQTARQTRRDTNFPSSWHGNQKGPLETRGVKKGRADESKNSGDIRKFMKSHAGKMTSMSSSFTDPAISAKKLARAGKHRKAGQKKQARYEIEQSRKLDKPQLP